MIPLPLLSINTSSHSNQYCQSSHSSYIEISVSFLPLYAARHPYRSPRKSLFLFFPHITELSFGVWLGQMGARLIVIALCSLFLGLCFYPYTASAQLKQNHYANVCPNVEKIVRDAVQKKFKQTFVTVPATIRLFFHDCFVQVKSVQGHENTIKVLCYTEPNDPSVHLRNLLL